MIADIQRAIGSGDLDADDLIRLTKMVRSPITPAHRPVVEDAELNLADIAAKVRAKGYKQFDILLSDDPNEYEANFRTAAGYDVIASAEQRAGKRGEARGLERAAAKATSFLVGDPEVGVPLHSPSPHQIADAIRALGAEDGEQA